MSIKLSIISIMSLRLEAFLSSSGVSFSLRSGLENRIRSRLFFIRSGFGHSLFTGVSFCLEGLNAGYFVGCFWEWLRNGAWGKMGESLREVEGSLCSASSDAQS